MTIFFYLICIPNLRRQGSCQNKLVTSELEQLSDFPKTISSIYLVFYVVHFLLLLKNGIFYNFLQHFINIRVFEPYGLTLYFILYCSSIFKNNTFYIHINIYVRVWWTICTSTKRWSQGWRKLGKPVSSSSQSNSFWQTCLSEMKQGNIVWNRNTSWLLYVLKKQNFIFKSNT